MENKSNEVQLYLADLIAPVYHDFYFDNVTKHYALAGGRSSAKGDTTYSKYIRMLLAERSRIIVFVPIQSSIKDGVFEQVCKVLDRHRVPYVGKISSNRIILDNESTIIFKGLALDNTKKKPEAFKGGDSRDPILAVIFDELASLDDRSKMDVIVETYARSARQFVYIWNPPLNRVSWLFKFIEELNDEADSKTLHTTVYDLPVEWVSDSLQAAKKMRKRDYRKWQHSYLGLATGVDNMASPVGPEKVLISMEELDQYMGEFRIWDVSIDNGNKDATTFTLNGLTTSGVLITIDVWYHSGRSTGEMKPYSEYALELKEWLTLFEGMEPDMIHCDDLNFALECRKIGIKCVNITGKKRGLMYTILREMLLQGRYKILDTDANQILLNQLMNATLEEVIENGSRVYAVKRPANNSKLEEEFQIHALDTILYSMLKLSAYLYIKT